MAEANILIVSLNSQYIHSSLAPWCLLSGIKAYGSDKLSANIYEGTINEKAEKAVSYVLAQAPEYLGFCCYIWNISRIREILPAIKSALPNVTIILGGPEVSYNQEDILRSLPEVDYIISGEGERPFPALIDALIEPSSIPSGMGISYRGKNEFIIAEPYISDEDPPSPYCSEYFDRLAGRISYIETSRGCPYSCAFCLSGRCGNARFFDLSKALEDITRIANSGTQTVKFVDRTFNANKGRAKEIIRFISNSYGKSLPKGVCFHFEIAGDILDDELIELLNEAPEGSLQLEIGMQSFNEDTLAAINRRTDTKILRNNILRLLEPQNIHIHVDLIAGLPLEDIKSFRDSFNTAFELKAHMLQMGFLKILHGAPMDTDRERFPCTYSGNPPYEVESTPWLSTEDISLLHLADHALDAMWCSGRFRESCNFLMKVFELSPFDFFVQIGKHLKNIKTPTDIAAELLEFTDKNLPKKSSELRDIMVVDWLSSNASGRLPPALVIHDARLKKLIISLEQNNLTKRKKGVKRSAAILYTQNKFIYADYFPEIKNPVTGKYPVHFLEGIL